MNYVIGNGAISAGILAAAGSLRHHPRFGQADARVVLALNLRRARTVDGHREFSTGTPKSRGDAAAAALRGFIEKMQASGFAADFLTHCGIVGASTLPTRRRLKPGRQSRALIVPC
jgi:hypothetical protein